MGWKDISELHLASLATEDDTLFDRVIQGKIAQARWNLEQRKSASSSSTFLYEGEEGEALMRALRVLGVERFADMGAPRRGATLSATYLNPAIQPTCTGAAEH